MKPPVRAPQPRLDALFPATTAKPPEHTFELGLVLGGTVSAGAYTAGALDFLLEALEAWYGEANRPHDVVIKTAGGSSGGAVCASILGLLSSRKVPHIHDDPGGKTGNPLWDLWVESFQITQLLSTTDLAKQTNADTGSGAQPDKVQHVAALLNCEMIDQGAAGLVAIGAEPGGKLPYFPAPFRVAITVANLRGIPYKILGIPAFATFSGAAYVQHDDFAWFAFPNGANRSDPDPKIGKREDEFWLSANPDGQSVPYTTLAQYGTASGAMPVGLAARALTRPSEHYLYRPSVRAVTDEPLGYVVDWPEPDWDGLPDALGGTYAFTAVDGGTFNNDPVTLVHRALAGLVGRNPRGSADANRALFMIDPLADRPKPIDPVGTSLLSVAEALITNFTSEARYRTADMDLFAQDDVYSRFQLVPFRPEPGRVGEAALSGTALFAAGGWCSRAFRAHDFMLGRSNMKDYLQKELLLLGSNPLFDKWDGDLVKDHACDVDGTPIAAGADRSLYYLPILPIDPYLANAAPRPDWPVGAVDPAALQPVLAGRLHAVLHQLLQDNGGGGLLPWAIGLVAVPGLADLVTTQVVTSFKTALSDAGLWPPPAGEAGSAGLS